MTNHALAVQPANIAAYESALIEGDLSQLSTQEKIAYYRNLCDSLGLNHLTQPFGYIKFPQGGMKLYAKKDATEQLRRQQRVSIVRLERETIGDLYVVTAYARTPDGREDSDMGAVNIKGKSGDDLVNAMLKAVTKAKRRVTLSICGLGLLDESELDTVRDAVETTAEAIDDSEPERPAWPVSAGTQRQQARKAINAAPSRPQNAGAELVATEPQVKAIYGFAKAKGLDADGVKEACAERYDGLTPASLTRRQASEFIDAIKALPNSAPAPADEDDDL